MGTISGTVHCFQCGQDNPQQQVFCGNCGSPLAIDSYISRCVKEQLSQQIGDRDVLEKESAIRVFERAWGWVKIVATLAGVMLAILGAAVAWKASDWSTSVDKSKQTVIDSSRVAQQQIESSSANATKEIAGVAGAAKRTIQDTSTEATREATQQSLVLNRSFVQARSGVEKERAIVKEEFDNVHTQLQAATELQPRVTTIQQDLSRAVEAIASQQKVLASQEGFVKDIFSKHRNDYFFQHSPPTRFRIAPRKVGQGATVFLLLAEAPIIETVQLQYFVWPQQPNTFRIFDNLVVFSWGDPAGGLTEHIFNVSYFPDLGHKDLIKALSEKDGRIYADNEPMPLFGEVDPGFTGNKWIPLPRIP